MSGNPLMKVHPDTVEGVKSMLDENFDHPPWTGDVEFTPDPWIYGVWLVEWPCGTECIAYLAGHKTPWGVKRDTNDAEFADEEQ